MRKLAEKVGTARSYIARVEKGETDNILIQASPSHCLTVRKRNRAPR